jgi:hypothetical protein
MAVMTIIDDVPVGQNLQAVLASLLVVLGLDESLRIALRILISLHSCGFTVPVAGGPPTGLRKVSSKRDNRIAP